MRKSCLIVLSVALAACGGPKADAPAPGSEEWFATATPKAQAQFFHAACEVYGLRKGSPEFAQCIREEADRRHAQNRAMEERATEARRAVLTQNRTTETHCSDFGSTRTCESY